MLDISCACNVLKHAISEVSYFPDQPLRSKIENVGPVSSRTSNSIMMDNEGASTVETTRVFARVDWLVLISRPIPIFGKATKRCHCCFLYERQGELNWHNVSKTCESLKQVEKLPGPSTASHPRQGQFWRAVLLFWRYTRTVLETSYRVCDQQFAATYLLFR